MKDRFQEILTHTSIAPSSSAVLQVQSAQESVELAAVQFDAGLVCCHSGQLKNADLKPFVPNTKAVDVPEQNLDSIALTIEEQEQVAR